MEVCVQQRLKRHRLGPLSTTVMMMMMMMMNIVDAVYRYCDYISVTDVSNIIRIPEGLPMDLAATLPCGALAAYSAVQRVKPFMQDKLENTTGT